LGLLPNSADTTHEINVDTCKVLHYEVNKYQINLTDLEQKEFKKDLGIMVNSSFKKKIKMT